VEPPTGSRGRASGQRVRGLFAPPLKLKHFLAFGRLLDVANLPTLKKIGNAKIQIGTICVVFRKNDVYRPQYVTDYCTVMKSNRFVHFW